MSPVFGRVQGVPLTASPSSGRRDMAKKGKTQRAAAAAPAQSRAHHPFPSVSQKDNLTSRVLLDDQIIVVDVSGGLVRTPNIS